MPKRDTKYMAARREEIVDAALAILIRDGAAALSTPALCREAGISTGALYTHFQSKNDVIGALADRTARSRREEYDFHDAGELRASMAKLARLQGHPLEVQKARADLEILLSDPDDERIRSAFREYAEARDLERGLARLVRVGELPSDLDPAAASLAISGLVLGLRILALMGAREDAPFDAAMELLARSILTTDAEGGSTGS
ncbi:MAG: TetR/AcrR family transcriptional regulator [Caulobacteraceae bacterium]|nr:TetR/AcrR family transcriptional regulator [Caulobacteraceae bacterium]